MDGNMNVKSLSNVIPSRYTASFPFNKAVSFTVVSFDSLVDTYVTKSTVVVSSVALLAYKRRLLRIHHTAFSMRHPSLSISFSHISSNGKVWR
jgi:PKD repeat protein